MGPRPFSRGDPVGWALTLLITSGFNGAATFQSRRLSAVRHPKTQSTLLQWGRDLSVAETAYSPRLPSITCCMLSV